MSTSTPVASSSTATFTRRSKTGFVLGLAKIQWLGVIGVGVLLAFAAFAPLPLPFKGTVLGCAVVLLATTLVKHDGRSGLTYTHLFIAHSRRKSGGHTMMTAPLQVGNIGLPNPELGENFRRLPGPAANLKAFEYEGRAYVYDTQLETMNWIAQVSAPDFLLAATTVQNQRVYGWGKAIAALCQPRGEIAQVQVMERITPNPGDSLERYFDENAVVEGEMADIYAQQIAAAGRGSAAHEMYVVVSVKKSAAVKRLRSNNSIMTMCAFTEQVCQPFMRALEPAGIKVIDRPSAKRLGRIVRSAYDPWGTLNGPTDGTAPTIAGPTGGYETPEYLFTDGMYHAAMSVFEFPAGASTRADFLWDVIFPQGVTGRTLTLFFRPFRVEETRSEIQNIYTKENQSSKMRDKLGRVETVEDQRERNDLHNRELELNEGHREVGIAAVITISENSVEALEESVSIMESAGHNGNMDIRRMLFQQSQIFAAAALPLGKVVVK